LERDGTLIERDATGAPIRSNAAQRTLHISAPHVAR
jgi:hypothetical protein